MARKTRARIGWLQIQTKPLKVLDTSEYDKFASKFLCDKHVKLQSMTKKRFSLLGKTSLVILNCFGALVY